MAGRLEGKTALVTGAGSIGPGWGNGKATAVLYAREGAKVAALDLNPAAAQETVDLINGEGGTAVALQADVANASEVEAAIARCISEFGRVDVLHNNVGIVEVGGPVEISETSWDRLMDVNVKSMFLTAKYAIPHMLEAGGGAIVNISSIASQQFMGYPSVSYGASKAAINMLTRNIAIQYARHGIRANAVLPGLMNTPLVEASVSDAYEGDVADMIRERDALCPTGKMGNAWDVAYASLFLASDEARYVTAQTLIVDGGISARVA